MKIESGVSMEDAQRAICTGEDYGRKEWSNAERQAACQKYEELTGTKLSIHKQSTQSADYSQVFILATVLLVGIFFIYIYRQKIARTRKK